MATRAFEGIVGHGLIVLPQDIVLPDHTKVYVMVTDSTDPQAAHIYSPRLAHPAQIASFWKEVIAPSDDGI